MRKFKGYVRTNKVGSNCTFEFEVEDDETDEEIEETAWECALEHIGFGYEEV